MKLSKNFTLAELTVTSVKAPNIPNEEQIKNLQALVDNVLQPLRDLYGKPIRINSGFRSLEVNKKIKGALKSQHMRGEAADISCENNALLFRLIRDTFDFDQLLWEKGNDIQPAWVHVSFSRTKNRKQILRIR
jgi:zinc D-Ala-D-Ala carboxypeptidase